jgi:hypothetical protein
MYAKAAPLFVLERASGDDRRVVAAAGAQSALSSTLSIHPLLWDGKESAIDVVSTLVPHLIKAVGDMTGDTSKYDPDRRRLMRSSISPVSQAYYNILGAS